MQSTPILIGRVDIHGKEGQKTLVGDYWPVQLGILELFYFFN